MNVYYCTKFTGHYPVGSAAVVVASNEFEAARLLNIRLQNVHGLTGDAQPLDMVELDTTDQSVVVLNDGDY